MPKTPMKFDDVDDYVESASTNLNLSFVPIPMAAEYLGIEVSTVRQYISAGRLAKIEIASAERAWSGVGLQSLAKFRSERDANIRSLASLVERKLIHQARLRLPAPYNDFMEPFGLDHTTSRDRELLGKVLGTISEKTWEDKRVMLSVMAVGKNSGTPNDAFFDLARRIGAMRSNEVPENFFRKQLREVTAAYC